jgi:hypothetical protein
LTEEVAAEHEYEPSAVLGDSEGFLQEIPCAGASNSLNLVIELHLDTRKFICDIWMMFR